MKKFAVLTCAMIPGLLGAEPSQEITQDLEISEVSKQNLQQQLLRRDLSAEQKIILISNWYNTYKSSQPSFQEETVGEQGSGDSHRPLPPEQAAVQIEQSRSEQPDSVEESNAKNLRNESDSISAVTGIIDPEQKAIQIEENQVNLEDSSR